MKVFHCDRCGQQVFFENVRCERCGATLCYLPELNQISAFEPEGNDLWRSLHPETLGLSFRMCDNYAQENVCNWMIAHTGDAPPDTLCQSCRLTHTIPSLIEPKNRAYWFKLEQAKRRLLYNLIGLRLPIVTKRDDPVNGIAFEFLESTDETCVMSGHDTGLITLNIEEADDAQRERIRHAMNEPYRTLLGHFRHESGHYYFMRLLRDNPAQLQAFRACFGDDSAPYDVALQRHYKDGPAPQWEQQYISAYASAHPAEDWAETWAHYLHMSAALETAQACGVELELRAETQAQVARDTGLDATDTAAGSVSGSGIVTATSPNEPDRVPTIDTGAHTGADTFDTMIARWFPLTYVLNSLNRSLGMPDGYPFTLAPAVIAKLRFVHQTIVSHTLAPGFTRPAPRS